MSLMCTIILNDRKFQEKMWGTNVVRVCENIGKIVTASKEGNIVSWPLSHTYLQEYWFLW